MNKSFNPDPEVIRRSVLYLRKGLKLAEGARKEAAIEYFKKALKETPWVPVLHYNIGLLMERDGNFREAAGHYRGSFSVNRHFEPGYYRMGYITSLQGRPKNAIYYYQKALEIKPDYAEAACGIADCYYLMNEHGKAQKYYLKAIKLNPHFARAYKNYATLLAVQNKISASIENFQKAVEIDPDFENALSGLVSQKRQICDWRDISKLEEKLNRLGGGEALVSVIINQDYKKNLECAKKWSLEAAKRAGAPAFSFPRLNKKPAKIKVGYLSSDFGSHATSHLILGLFKNHDHGRFETFVYSYGADDKSGYRAKIKKDADHFFDISTLGDQEAVEKIHEDGIDILIDLKGHTLGNRLEIIVKRPARITATWLGFPGTTGASFIDYAIVDKTVVPKDAEKYFTEKPAYLPHTYQITNDEQEISGVRFARSDFGLPEKAFVFACFCQGYKIDEEVFESWMRILKRVPESFLWLWKSSSEIEINLKAEAKKTGIDPKRLVFSDALVKPQHLKRLGLADLALDTFCYNGHTTTSDCLWAGVPVVTLKGKHFASRVSASLLTAIGLSELITTTQKRYEALAVKLAESPELLKRFREKLRENKLTKPLFNTKLFVKSLETLYVKFLRG